MSEDQSQQERPPPDGDTPASRQRPKRGFFRRWTRRLWAGFKLLVLLLIVGGVGYVLWTNYQGEQAKQRVLQEMRDRNLPTSVEAMRERLIPEGHGENGAKYYRAAFELASDFDGPTENLPIIGVHGPVMPAPGRPLPSDWKHPLKRFVEDNAELYQLLDEAQGRDHFVYGVNFGPYWQADIDAVSGLRSVACSLQLRALHRELSGNADEAGEAIADILNASHSFRHDRFRIVDLVRISILALAYNDLHALLSRQTLSTSTLRQLDKAFARERKHLDMATSQKMEVAATAERLDSIHKYTAMQVYSNEHGYEMANRMRVKWNKMLSDTFGRAELPSNLAAKRPSPWNKWLIRTTLNVDRVHKSLIPGAYEVSLADTIEGRMTMIQRWERNPEATRRNLALRNDDPKTQRSEYEASLTALAGTLGHMWAGVRITRLAIGAELFRIEHGRWPANPEELTDNWRSDPFSDEDLRYKHFEEGIVVYSVGRDGEDDGGLQTDVFEPDKDIAFRLFDPGVRGKREPKSDTDAADTEPPAATRSGASK